MVAVTRVPRRGGWLAWFVLAWSAAFAIAMHHLTASPPPPFLTHCGASHHHVHLDRRQLLLTNDCASNPLGC